jgi:serine/threonine-protein kinase
MANITLKGTKGTYTFNPFDNGALLGKGGTGNVFKGENTLTKDKVAIKVLFSSLTEDSGILQRLQLEASLKFEHPNIIKVLDFVHDKTTNIYHLITEYIDGETLDKVIDQHKLNNTRLSIEKVKHFGLCIARGLEVLHNNLPQIIHRDIKPSNIMICKDGNVKLMDLGIAKVVEVNDTTKQITSVGAIIGTYHY